MRKLFFKYGAVYFTYTHSHPLFPLIFIGELFQHRKVETYTKVQLIPNVHLILRTDFNKLML